MRSLFVKLYMLRYRRIGSLWESLQWFLSPESRILSTAPPLILLSNGKERERPGKHHGVTNDSQILAVNLILPANPNEMLIRARSMYAHAFYPSRTRQHPPLEPLLTRCATLSTQTKRYAHFIFTQKIPRRCMEIVCKASLNTDSLTPPSVSYAARESSPLIYRTVSTSEVPNAQNISNVFYIGLNVCFKFPFHIPAFKLNTILHDVGKGNTNFTLQVNEIVICVTMPGK